MTVALVVTTEGPFEEVELREYEGSALAHLQELVGGGLVQALPLPRAVFGHHAGRATAYVNEDGKARPDLPTNRAATDFLVPGVGLLLGDHVAGPMVLVGFDPETGEHRPTLPPPVIRRARLIESEARR